MIAMMARNPEPMFGDLIYPATLVLLGAVPYLARKAGDAWDRWTRTPMTTPAARRPAPPGRRPPMTEFAFNATANGGSVTIEAGSETFVLPYPGPSPITGIEYEMTHEEAETLAALLNTITVEALNRQPFREARAAATGFMLAVNTHLRFAETARFLAAEAEAAGATVNHEALAPLTGGPR